MWQFRLQNPYKLYYSMATTSPLIPHLLNYSCMWYAFRLTKFNETVSIPRSNNAGQFQSDCSNQRHCRFQLDAIVKGCGHRAREVTSTTAETVWRGVFTRGSSVVRWWVPVTRWLKRWWKCCCWWGYMWMSGIWCAVESRKAAHASSSVKDKEKKIDNFTQWEQLPL